MWRAVGSGVAGWQDAQTHQVRLARVYGEGK